MIPENTQYTGKMKVQAISEVLGSLFTDSCKYTEDVLTRFNEPMEPDIEALNLFRGYLNEMAMLARVQKFEVLKNHLLKVVKPFVHDTGFKYGHVTYSYTTGTWGVRYHTLDQIADILDIESIPYLNNKMARLYDIDVTIEYKSISSYGVWYTLNPVNPEVHSFSIELSWENLKNKDLRGLIILEDK